MTITLDEIRAAHSRIGEMITALEKQASASFPIAATTIALAAGERYAGIVLDEHGALSHHLVLLPGQADDVNWEDAKKWATQQGGELPTRREQSLLFANLKHEFEERAYWSGERHAEESGWAWFQFFLDGYQYDDSQGFELRARAVRRFIPSVI